MYKQGDWFKASLDAFNPYLFKRKTNSSFAWQIARKLSIKLIDHSKEKKEFLTATNCVKWIFDYVLKCAVMKCTHTLPDNGLSSETNMRLVSCFPYDKSFLHMHIKSDISVNGYFEKFFIWTLPNSFVSDIYPM